MTSVLCLGCRNIVELDSELLRKYERAGAVAKRPGTGEWQSGNWIPKQDTITACQDCLRAERAATASVGLQVRWICQRSRELALELARERKMTVGKVRRQAIRQAVEEQMSSEERRRFPAFHHFLRNT